MGSLFHVEASKSKRKCLPLRGSKPFDGGTAYNRYQIYVNTPPPPHWGGLYGSYIPHGYADRL